MLFSAEIVIPNEGVLAKDMVATATTIVNGDTVYPYEAAKLQYYRVGDLNSTVSGTVISSNLVDYLAVTPGQVLVRIDGEDSETEIFTAQQNLEEAQKKLEAAQKNLDNCNAVAPISGQVIGLSVTPGQELQANSTLVTVSDTSTVTVSATVDERNISYIKTGMSVNLDQWGTSAFGTVETVSLAGLNISFCRGCFACHKTLRCVINDDAPAIVEKMCRADVIVWATPVYYYSCSGQMKTMIDRANPLYTADYRFTDVYLLASAAENEPETVDGTVTAVKGWTDCFERATLRGVVFAGGVTDKGDIAGHKALAEAREMGRKA